MGCKWTFLTEFDREKRSHWEYCLRVCVCVCVCMCLCVYYLVVFRLGSFSTFIKVSLMRDSACFLYIIYISLHSPHTCTVHTYFIYYCVCRSCLKLLVCLTCSHAGCLSVAIPFLDHLICLTPSLALCHSTYIWNVSFVTT